MLIDMPARTDQFALFVQRDWHSFTHNKKLLRYAQITKLRSARISFSSGDNIPG